MKKVLKILLLFIIFGAVWYQYQDTIRLRVVPFFNQVITELGIKNAPCTEPIVYTLGIFDTQFKISQSYFLNALTDAEAIWEKPARPQDDSGAGGPFGKELFQYNSTDEPGGAERDVLKINLVYDYRQQATSKLKSLGIEVKDTRASYEELKIKLLSLKNDFTKAKNDYENQVESFNSKQRTYGEKVKYWNAQGGAPKKEYDELQAEKMLLDGQVSQLQNSQAKVNNLVEEINALVVVLNRLVNTLNISVEKYNTIGASRGESFEEGVYETNGVEQFIEIYEFSSREKLVRVLAHELGHALGLDHVEDPKAIMYKLNQGNNETLTPADLEVLKIKCGVK